ncbi:uncharacterized protein DS421_13g436960 [Arachis hypogaea]|nr:uncharacterized protein DS421_13g436960 [Arachis hypogaea]
MSSFSPFSMSILKLSHRITPFCRRYSPSRHLNEEALSPFFHFCEYNYLLVSLVLCRSLSFFVIVALCPSLSISLALYDYCYHL